MRVLQIAEWEAIDAAFWYDNRESGYGADFLHELEEAYARISKHMRSNSKYELYDGPYEVRRRILKRFPYLVIYTIDNVLPVVIAVAHTSREPLYWVDRLKSLS